MAEIKPEQKHAKKSAKSRQIVQGIHGRGAKRGARDSMRSSRRTRQPSRRNSEQEMRRSDSATRRALADRFALKELNAAEEARVATPVKRAVS